MRQKGFIGIAALIAVLGGGYYEMTKLRAQVPLSDANQLPVLQIDNASNPQTAPVMPEKKQTDAWIEISSPKAGDVFSQDQKMTVNWKVAPSVLAQFPSDFNVVLFLYVQKQNDPTTANSSSVGDGNVASEGSAVWDISKAQWDASGRFAVPVDQGQYKIVAQLSAEPKDHKRLCAIATGKDCSPDAAAAAIIKLAAQYKTETGWFTITSATALKTYTNDTYGISLQYPASLTAVESKPSSGSVSTGIVSITSGPETLGVGISAAPSDVGTCTVVPGGSERSVSNASTVTINGVSFLTYTVGDVAMGHYTGTKLYRTLHNNACYTISVTTESTAPDRLSTDQAAQQRVALDTAASLIDPIVQTFRFSSDTANVLPPTCTLTANSFIYKLGDVITLKWNSRNALRALWDQAADQGTGIRKVIIAPEGDPETNGTGKTIANIEGYQPIKLLVTGPGGYGDCSTYVSISHSDAKPSITVDSVRLTGTNGLYNNDRNTSVTLSGTATNGGLYNNEVNIVLFDPSYDGPFDEASIYRIAFNYSGQFYSGGTQPGVREDSVPYKSWSTETFIPRGVTQVRVLAYYPFYSAGSPTSSNVQPIVNEVLSVTQ